MKRTLYHGSENIIERPAYGGGKPYNDYGRGFYCTEVSEMAKEWAVGAGRDGFVNCYALEEKGLRKLDLGSSEYCILHWLTVLLQNRTFAVSYPLAREAKQYLTDHFSLPLDQYDVIVGYRADDSYFSFAQDFINGAISVRQLNQAMHLGKLGEQYVIKSKKTFERLTYRGYEPASAEEWYIRRQRRDRQARDDYRKMSAEMRQKEDLYIMQIMDEEIGADDARLR